MVDIHNNSKFNLYLISKVLYNIPKDNKGELNLSRILNMQLSVFGNFAMEIKTTNIVEIMLELNKKTNLEFLPNVISSQNIDLSTNKVTNVSNMSFVTNDHKYSLVILNDRIDFNFNNTNEAYEFEIFYSYAKKVVCSVMNKKNLMSNRLALNIHLINEIRIDDRINTLYNKMINGFDFYKQNQVFEWSSRVNAKNSIEIISSQQEEINTITELVIARDLQSKEPIMVCHMDINTMQDNNVIRFSSNNLSDYVNNIKPIVNEITKNFKEFDVNE